MTEETDNDYEYYFYDKRENDWREIEENSVIPYRFDSDTITTGHFNHQHLA